MIAVEEQKQAQALALDILINAKNKYSKR